MNKPFKELLREHTELYTDAREDAGDDIEKWSVNQKRVMVTHVVREAWNQFCTEKKSLIEKSFIDIGLNIALDGSEDSKLLIKGYEHGKPEIGDWSRMLRSHVTCGGLRMQSWREAIGWSELRVTVDHVMDQVGSRGLLDPPRSIKLYSRGFAHLVFELYAQLN